MIQALFHACSFEAVAVVRYVALGHALTDVMPVFSVEDAEMRKSNILLATVLGVMRAVQLTAVKDTKLWIATALIHIAELAYFAHGALLGGSDGPLKSISTVISKRDVDAGLIYLGIVANAAFFAWCAYSSAKANSAKPKRQ